MFKVGDKVIVTKSISKIYSEKAVVTHIGEGFYRVCRSKNKDDRHDDYCNIFYNHSGESIELDLQEVRNDKLKNLGI